MKITVFLFLIVAFCSYAECVDAQNARVTIPSGEIKISDLLSTIEDQTEYLFVYSKRNIDVRRLIHFESNNKPVAEILDEVFRGTDIRYVMEGNNIVLTKNEEITAIVSFLQNRVTLKGIVVDMLGEPIVGANILEKGTSNGVISSMDGSFSLNVAKGSELLVSFMGYKPKTIVINGKTNFIIRLEEEALTLETVVVTAMGIKKKETSLTYSAQLINNEELTRVKETNFIYSLSGKTAGVQINRISSGLGSSAKVNIRGSRSITGNNQPLYVVDGVPMLNNTSEQASTIMGGVADTGNRDGGDGISNLNPDDIESMSILKGASAAALYGSQAANGVILITTKKGKAGIQEATFSTNTTFDNALFLPKFQNVYGNDANNMNWGPDYITERYDNTDRFFQNGFTTINSVTLTKGKEDVQTYFSYANTFGKGIIEGNKLTKHNLNFRETASFFQNRLTLDANINLMQQTLKNRPTSGGLYMNPLVGLYTYVRGEDLGYYKDNFEVYNKDRNLYVQNWYKTINGFEQNPYWILYRVLSNDQRYRTISNLSANLKLNYWLTLQARATVDYINDKYTQKMYASTATDIAGIYTPENSKVDYPNGRYINVNHSELLIYTDAMLLLDKTWNNWSLNGALGVSLNTTIIDSQKLDSKIASLYYPNIFTVSNIVMNSNANIEEKIGQRRELQSIFGTAQIGWKESLFLDVTARNDWSSTLAFTKQSSFFYPSVGLSWILSNTLQLPKWVSYGKVRTSWAQVGNDLPLFYSKLEDRIAAGGVFQANSIGPFDELKPELSSSFEIGTEWKLFNQRLDLEFTYYKTVTKNQLLTLPSSAGALFKYYMVNAGKIENSGFEISLGGTPVLTQNFRWKTNINFSSNHNKIVTLHPQLKSFLYGPEGFSMHYAMRLKEGGSFGDIYGWKFDRDENGKIKLDEKGVPKSIGSGNTEKVGNSSPKCMLGWSHLLTYKDFFVNFLIDARIGGDVVSMTQGELDYRGVSYNTGKARQQGFVQLENHRFTDVEAFYKSVSARNSLVTEYYLYDATNVRLREVSIGYSVPKSILEKMRICKSIDLSLIGRNLLFLYKKTPFDPDLTLSANNDNQGVDVFNMPAVRSIGFNVRFVF